MTSAAATTGASAGTALQVLFVFFREDRQILRHQSEDGEAGSDNRAGDRELRPLRDVVRSRRRLDSRDADVQTIGDESQHHHHGSEIKSLRAVAYLRECTARAAGRESGRPPAGRDAARSSARRSASVRRDDISLQTAESRTLRARPPARVPAPAGCGSSSSRPKYFELIDDSKIVIARPTAIADRKKNTGSIGLYQNGCSLFGMIRYNGAQRRLVQRREDHADRSRSELRSSKDLQRLLQVEVLQHDRAQIPATARWCRASRNTPLRTSPSADCA